MFMHIPGRTLPHKIHGFQRLFTHAIHLSPENWSKNFLPCEICWVESRSCSLFFDDFVFWVLGLWAVDVQTHAGEMA